MREPRHPPGRRRNVVLLQVFCLAASPLLLQCAAVASSPLEKVVELISNLQKQVALDGEREEAAYRKYRKWCKATSAEKQNKINNALKLQAKEEAALQLATANEEAAVVKIDELSGVLSTNGEKVKAAEKQRADEASIFKAAEQKLTDAIDALRRAADTLERESQASSVALVQTTVNTQSLQNVLLGLGSIIDTVATFTEGGDGGPAKRLVALLESGEADEDEDGSPGAPNAEVYQKESGSIMDLLEDMRDKAEEELRLLRKTEANNRHNFKSVTLALQHEIDEANKDVEAQKRSKAAALEKQASSQGALQELVKSIANSKDALEKTRRACIATAAEYDQTSKSRETELDVLAKAKKIVQSAMAEALVQAPTEAPVEVFMQMASSRSNSAHAVAGRKAAAVLAQLAQLAHGSTLSRAAQRLSRAAAAAGARGRAGEDPFVKVKGQIESMLRKLEHQAATEATEKTFCDDTMAKTNEKHEELVSESEEAEAKIDKATSTLTMLRAQVQDLNEELGEIANQQAEMDRIRISAHSAYTTTVKDLKEGLSVVRKAIQTLKEYYAAADETQQGSLLEVGEELGEAMEQPARPQTFKKSTSASQSIIGLLETIESDSATSLAKEEAQESDQQSQYEKLTQENKVLQTQKEQATKHKSQECSELSKLLVELNSDATTTKEELAAVSDYLSKVKERCVAKPEQYEDRRRRREQELEGLRSALRILDEPTGHAGFLQRRSALAS